MPKDVLVRVGGNFLGDEEDVKISGNGVDDPNLGGKAEVCPLGSDLFGNGEEGGGGGELDVLAFFHFEFSPEGFSSFQIIIIGLDMGIVSPGLGDDG